MMLAAPVPVVLTVVMVPTLRRRAGSAPLMKQARLLAVSKVSVPELVNVALESVIVPPMTVSEP